jgi:PBSX family phage terminase large subunit
VNLGALPLSAKQIDFIANSNSRINAATGAIRSGKTLSSLLRWLIYVASAPPGELVVVAKTSQTAARNIFAPLQDFALFGDLAGQTHYTPGAPSATMLGRRVWVIGANDVRSESRLRGLTCAGAMVDEATLVPQNFFTQLLGRMSVPGSKLFLTSNPDNPAHWLRRDYLLRSGELDLASWHFTLDDNPALADEYKAAIKAEFTGLWYKRFVEGMWIAAEGAIFDMWDADRHVVDIMPPIVQWIAAGVDHGTVNPFAANMLGLGANGNLYLTAEYRYDSKQAHRQMSDAEYSQAFRQWLLEVPIPGSRRADGSSLTGVQPEYICVDPSAASFRVQLHNDGLTSVAADNSVLDGIRLVSSLLATDRLFVHRSCEGFTSEVGGYSWSDEARLKGEDKPIKTDDHNLDAARYAIKSTRSVWASRVNLAA